MQGVLQHTTHFKVMAILAIKAGEPGYDAAICVGLGVLVGAGLLLCGLLWWIGRVIDRANARWKRHRDDLAGGFEVKQPAGYAPATKEKVNDHG